MKKIMLAVIAGILVQFSASAEHLNLNSIWNTDKSNASVITNVSATAGTSASVTFKTDVENLSYSVAGVYNQFSTVSLGTNDGDSITLSFTLSMMDTNGAAYNLDNRFICGISSLSEGVRVWSSFDTGTFLGSDAQQADFGYSFNPTYVGAGYYFREYESMVNGFADGSVHTTGAGADADTSYAIVLTRQADGSATMVVSQIKTDNNWSSVPVSFTQAQADTFNMDSIFFGQWGSYDAPELIFSITDISVDVNPATFALMDISGTWNTDKSYSSVITNVSGTGGTSASVSFNTDVSSLSYSVAGVYGTFDKASLGSEAGDSITLSFTASIADTNGAAHNLDQRFIFGLFSSSTSARVWSSVDTGTASGGYGDFNRACDFGYSFDSTYIGAGYCFREYLTVVNGVEDGSVFLQGAGPNADTSYTLVLTRQADGTATMVVSQVKEGNSWTSLPVAFTQAEANSFSMDSIFFGQWGSYDAPELVYSITGITVGVDPIPSTNSLVGYDAWAEQFGGTNVIGAATNDYDGDGLINLYEYGLGGNPTNALDQGTSPQYGIVEQGGTSYFGYVYPQVTNADSGLTYSLETSTNLVSGTWTNAGYTVLGTNLVGGMNMVSNYTDTVDSQKFIRLMISTNTP